MSQDPGQIYGLRRKIEGDWQEVSQDPERICGFADYRERLWEIGRRCPRTLAGFAEDLAAGAGAGAGRRCPRTLALALSQEPPFLYYLELLSKNLSA